MSEEAIDEILDRVWQRRRLLDTGQDSCECCGAEPSIGVASIPGVPMSIAWGRRCLDAGAVPLWVLFAQIGFEAHPSGVQFGREMFAPWWLEIHDATLRYFGVTEEEFWAAINA